MCVRETAVLDNDNTSWSTDHAESEVPRPEFSQKELFQNEKRDRNRNGKGRGIVQFRDWRQVQRMLELFVLS